MYLSIVCCNMPMMHFIELNQRWLLRWSVSLTRPVVFPHNIPFFDENFLIKKD